jgi:hypothetical protein|tara:strand:- start:130 stop:252 length:123 start_codon:yes stop_codon:yes gene_type:complete
MGALFCTIAGNQQQRLFDEDLKLQIEDFRKVYRPKQGADA